MDWPKYIIEYGPLAAVVLLIAVPASLYFLVRKQRYFLPRGVLSWTWVVCAGFIIYTSVRFLSCAPAKIYPMRAAYQYTGQKPPDLAFNLVSDGSKRSLSEYKGKVVLLNLWATWCPPCRAEMPTLDRLQRQYADQGLVVVTVSDEPAKAILKFPGIESMAFVKGRLDPDQINRGGIYIRSEVARPMSYIIDRDGILRETFVDQQAYDTFKARLEKYLKNPPHPVS